MAYKKLKLWFDEELAALLADKIEPIYSKFPTSTFIQEVKEGVETLELKDRVELMADLLQEYLPNDYKKAVHILLQTLGSENEQETGMFTEYYWVMPFAKMVEKYGLEDFDTSMNAIAAITKRNTGEYAIRPYLEKYPERTLEVMLDWSNSKNVHLRRLSSEGTRIRLPWAKKLDLFEKHSIPILQILDNLKDDDSKFVQKSVGNHMNDLLKDYYDITMQTLRRWIETAGKNRKWIIKHALRNEVKKDNPDALEIIK